MQHSDSSAATDERAFFPWHYEEPHGQATVAPLSDVEQQFPWFTQCDSDTVLPNPVPQDQIRGGGGDSRGGGGGGGGDDGGGVDLDPDQEDAWRAAEAELNAALGLDEQEEDDGEDDRARGDGRERERGDGEEEEQEQQEGEGDPAVEVLAEQTRRRRRVKHSAHVASIKRRALQSGTTTAQQAAQRRALAVGPAPYLPDRMPMLGPDGLPLSLVGAYTSAAITTANLLPHTRRQATLALARPTAVQASMLRSGASQLLERLQRAHASTLSSPFPLASSSSSSLSSSSSSSSSSSASSSSSSSVLTREMVLELMQDAALHVQHATMLAERAERICVNRSMQGTTLWMPVTAPGAALARLPPTVLEAVPAALADRSFAVDHFYRTSAAPSLATPGPLQHG